MNHNDTDLPPDELIAAISDIVFDVKPDLASCNAGTLTERVQACRDAMTERDHLRARVRELEEALRIMLDLGQAMFHARENEDGHRTATLYSEAAVKAGELLSQGGPR